MYKFNCTHCDKEIEAGLNEGSHIMYIHSAIHRHESLYTIERPNWYIENNYGTR